MGIGLQLANRNDFVKVEEHINNNLSNLEEMIDNNSGKKITGYIQDEGEKVVGNYYLDKLTAGLFMCIKSGNINYNSADFFEDYSNKALRENATIKKTTGSYLLASLNNTARCSWVIEENKTFKIIKAEIDLKDVNAQYSISFKTYFYENFGISSHGFDVSVSATPIRGKVTITKTSDNINLYSETIITSGEPLTITCSCFVSKT